ncbi:MAG: aliphatic sulfonate ABC transporter substrate-binding protein, partial [Betaproteobacteria bacterium]|nr:aliphatic sulfonate ABC transporter substrate-binding protein [Betaproteobacteria bacterium]
KWVQSAGSNKALEGLDTNTIDFGSTAGLAAVLARANGKPLKAVYVCSRPGWTALMVPKDSPIKKIEDLKGKKIAATKGTDPYLFTLRSLSAKGLKKTDVDLQLIQHADGRKAMEEGKVDAWAGLDPLMAASELDAGSRALYRNVDFNTYCVINVTESFAQKHGDAIKRVIQGYERARKWITDNPDKAAQLLSEEAKISLPVAQKQMDRTDLVDPVIGSKQANAWKAAGSILVEEELVKKGTDVNAVVDGLVEPKFVKEALGK